MTVFAATVIYLLADFAYALLRKSRVFPKLGRPGRLLESIGITAVTMVWVWQLSPSLFDSPPSAGIAIFAYAPVFVVCAGLLWYVGKPITSPLGISSILLVVVFLVMSLFEFLFANPTAGVSTYFSASLPYAMGGSLFAGSYVAGWAVDDAKRIARSERSEPTGSGASDDLNDIKSERGLEETTASTAPANSDGTFSSVKTKTERDSRESAPAFQEYSYDWRRSPIGFEDIGGYYNVKNDLYTRVIEPIAAADESDDRFSRFGIEPTNGVMFYGPPGTGKTMFARALAGELGVPFVELSPGDITSRWINASSEQIKILFDEAASLGQCVIFLDEAEHLFGARDVSDLSSHVEDRKVTSEFLAQLSREDREAIVVSATNRPGDIDPAILRPGRLSTHFEIGLPDEEARHAILNVHLADVPSSLSGEELADLATQTDGLTGAELDALVDDARRRAADRDAEAIVRSDFPSIEELTERTESVEPDPADLLGGPEDMDSERTADSDPPDPDDRRLGYQ
jgi:AAA+ superfamily predicted ATPase